MVDNGIFIDNQEYQLFVNMIGEYFDGIWSYIKALTLTNSRLDKFSEGLPKDLTYFVGKSSGFNFQDGNQKRKLWRYISKSTIIRY